MNGADRVSGYFKFFARLGDLFEARFLRPLWERYPSRENDAWEAVGLFLDGYAFARQGARPDYSHVGVDVVLELGRRGQSVTDKNTTELAWRNFCSRLNEQKLNRANNPLCPQGTGYERKTGSAVTHSRSIIEFVCSVSETGFQPNIVVLARTGLELDRAESVHSMIGEINGIGSKIASLFLRDVAVFYDLFPSKERHLLQPVDVWVRRTCDQLMSQLNTNIADIEEIQRWILQGSLRADVRPEAVNEGIWYFSSQVAGSDYRMSKALNDLGYAKALLDEHIEAVRRELRALDNLVGR